MNTNLTVRLSADANDIPVKYRVVEMTTGGATATTYCVLMVVRVGWNTFANYDLWKATKYYDTDSGITHLNGRDPAGMQGVLGTLSVVALSTVVSYGTPAPDSDQ